MSETMKFRKAVPGDEGLILTFIRELADYEGMLDQVVADEATLHTWIFEKEKAEVLFVLEGETEVGFALFFHNFSTFLGRRASTWRTCMSGRSAAERAMERPCFGSWRRSPWNGAAAGWSGGAWTGTGPPLIFIPRAWGPNL